MKYWNAYVGDEPHRKVADTTTASWAAARDVLIYHARSAVEENDDPEGCPHCKAQADRVVADLLDLIPGSTYRGDIELNAFILRSAVLPS